MGKLTDKQKQEIIASYIECENYSEVARRYNVSDMTVRRLVKNPENKDVLEKVEQKREENTQEVLKEMSKRNKTKIALIDKIFNAMDKKLDNVDMFTNIKDLATAYGIIMDKELKLKEIDVKNDNTIQRIQIINDLPEDEENGTNQD